MPLEWSYSVVVTDICLTSDNLTRASWSIVSSHARSDANEPAPASNVMMRHGVKPRHL